MPSSDVTLVALPINVVLLAVPGRSVSLGPGDLFARELTLFRAPEVPLAPEVIHAGARVHPHNDIARAFERGRWGMQRCLCPAWRRKQAGDDDEYEV
jgi:hypothetical protein